MANKILRAKDVAEKMGVSRTTVFNKANGKSRHFDPEFPRPFKVSENCTGWLEHEIEAYIERLASRRIEPKTAA